MRRVTLNEPAPPEPLAPWDIADRIPSARTGEYLGADIIEINCKERTERTTQEEQWLLKEQGYVPLFSHLVVGWDMWIKHADAQTNIFFQNQRLPLTLRPL